MDLATTPATLSCSLCGDAITDTGYLPATEGNDGHDPHPGEAVCDACGFNDIGMTGCAPELGDVDAGSADALLYVRVTDDGLDVVSAKG